MDLLRLEFAVVAALSLATTILLPVMKGSAPSGLLEEWGGTLRRMARLPGGTLCVNWSSSRNDGLN